MPLSEEELRLLEQMERALVEEDPKFASTLRGTSLHTSARRRVVLAGTAFAAGVTLLMTGAIVQMPYVGVAGFVVMLLAATIGLGAFRTQRTAGPDAARQQHPSGFTVVDGGRSGRTRRQSRPRSSGSFMERMEERWRRRRESGGF
ncbi:DUF3040 domain-containing protein [Nocardioides sp. R-C-SC26]|uniref:DUF3040 domain-containing protein n=1 Tax=Nocardioides sp. R-C-SC26 TaxID=2870414 RepID=UPI001E312832|nr:DUF3040 domain-containing protein [Nocardioides sp. R-C-SC26]